MPERRRWLPEVVNFPKTTTILALGFLAGNFLLLPVLAIMGRYVPETYESAVSTVALLFKDGMLLILGFYFRGQIGGSDRGAALGEIEIEAGYREQSRRQSTRDDSASSQ